MGIKDVPMGPPQPDSAVPRREDAESETVGKTTTTRQNLCYQRTKRKRSKGHRVTGFKWSVPKSRHALERHDG